MKGIFVISKNTFKELTRQKIFFIIVFFGFTMLFVTFFLYPLSVGEQSKILRDFGLSAITFFNILLVIITGSTLLHKEMDKRTIYLVITTPVRRREIIIGKFFGLLSVVLVNVFFMEFFHQLLILLNDKRFDFNMFVALYPFIYEISVIISLLIFFSTFTGVLFSAFIGFLFYIIGHLIESLKLFAEITKYPLLKFLSYTFYYILPNFEHFNIKNKIVYEGIPGKEYFIFSSFYGLVYIIFLIYLSTIIFERKEFK
ncbi:MAG: ABC transporter permease subunit [Candidatus Hydrothermales bacterium]